MNNLKIETVLYDKCICCFGEGELKNMWEEYIWNGKTEIYGEMLSECFDMNLEPNGLDSFHQEQICMSCIGRLRDALDFRREVMVCSQLRHEHFNNSFDIEVKTETLENEDISIEYHYVEADNDTEKEPHEKRNDILMNFDTGNMMLEGSDESQDFDEVQYLDLDFDDNIEGIDIASDVIEKTQEKDEAIYSQNILENSLTEQDLKQDKRKTRKRTRKQDLDYNPSSPETSSERKPQSKWPKKKKHPERTYKQYTREDMQRALDAIESGAMSRLEAANEYRIPIKTLNHRLLLAKKNAHKSEPNNRKTESYFNYVDEVKKVLTYTNAVPFKTKAARYFCAYCSTDGPFFEEPEDLRIHTRTKHVEDKMKNIEIMLRPQGHNEVLKVDIDAFHCTICCTVLPTWNSMFQHLEGSHDIKLDEAYTRIIPYILKRDLKCALCKESFTNYHHLDGHMNTHYSNYICQECGDTFLSFIRWDKHVRIHQMKGRFPCKECGKVFTLEKYMQKHYDHVHKKEHNIKCVYCPEKFLGNFQRHQHMVEHHKEKIKVITCELCGVRFDWKAYYVAHLRKKHKILQKI